MGSTMRLGAKIVLATLVALVVLSGVAIWSLGAVNRLVEANRRIALETVPALRREAALDAAATRLVRLHTRWMVLREPAYETLWTAQADAFDRDLAGLPALLASPEERRLHRKVDAAFGRYRALVSETASGRPRLRPRLGVDAARGARRTGERVARGLDRLTQATSLAAARLERHADELETRTWRAVVLALPAGVLLSLALSALIAVRMTRALRRLATASARVAQGAFAERVPVGASDEVGALARAFNSMAARLGELDRMKEQLFAHVSHELRTPLTSIREAGNLLADRVPGPLAPRQARLVEIINDSTDRLLRLVDRILDLSRLRAGLLPLEHRPVHLQAVAARALAELRLQAEAGHVTLVRDDRADLWVRGDEERLVEVLVNLVSNAIRATGGGGTVRVALARDDDAGVVAVSDDGAGVAPEALPRIFEPYVQAPGARGGTGLGLAIVKSIVEAHGGAVAAESSVGRGSRFTVRIPAAEAVA